MLITISKKRILFIFFIVVLYICQFRVALHQGYIIFPLEVILIFFMWMWSSKQKKILYKLTWIYILFILYRLMSVFFSEGPLGSVKLLIYSEFGMLLLCHFFVKDIMGGEIIKFIRNVGVVLSILGVYEFVTHSSIFVNLISVESKVFIVSSLGSSSARIRTIFMHPVICGVYTVIFWLAVLYFPYKNKWINYTAKVAIIISLLGTQSRSSWLSFVIVNIMFLLLKKKLLIMKVSKNFIYQFLFIILVSFIGIIFFKNAFAQEIEVLSSRLFNMFNTEHIGVYNRLGMITLGIRTWISSGLLNKLFGNGRDFAINLLKRNPIRGWSVAVDNQYVTILLDYGLVGILFFILLLVRVTLYTIKNDNPVNRCCGLAILSMFISAFFYDMFTWITITFIFCLLICVMQDDNVKDNTVT